MRMNNATTNNKSRIPTPQGINHGDRRETTSSTGATAKTTFDKGKNAVELKQRLASAVSAKIASANREGRTTNTNNNNNNRGIGYLLQRKQQHDSKLNTKAISFQKPIRNNNGGETRNGDGIEAKSGNNLRSGTNDLSKRDSQKSLLSALMSSRVASGMTVNTKQSGVARPDTTPVPAHVDPTLSGSGNKITMVPNRKSQRNGTTTNVNDKDSRVPSSSLLKKKVEKPLFGAKTAVISRGNGEQNKAKGTINRNASLSMNYKKENASLPTKTTPNPGMSTDKIASKTLDVNANDSHMTKTSALLTKATSPSKQLVLENENRGNTDTDATTSNENSSSRNVVVPGKSSTVSKRDHKFREDLLEKLEADVGSCKIVAFQNMEDFSLLRMRIYRIRGDLEQLKKMRERRTAPAV